MEPEAQLQYTYVAAADYDTSQDSKVRQDAVHSLIGRAGLNLGLEFESLLKGSVYAACDVRHEFLGRQHISASDLTGSLDRTYHERDTWYAAGVGFNNR